jgi:hypothetical protein
MKKVLPLIPTVGIFTIFTAGILVSAPKSASAFCVHNLTGDYIRGDDSVRQGWLTALAMSTKTWAKTLAPDQRDCLID